MFSILYVSRSRLSPEAADGDIDAIVEVSLARNPPSGVTGALLFTGDRFAQLLEGPEQSVLTIMASIRRDARHTDIVVVDEGPIAARRFASWSMAYAGRSTFAARTVETALTGGGFGVRNLIRLLQELARSSP